MNVINLIDRPIGRLVLLGGLLAATVQLAAGRAVAQGQSASMDYEQPKLLIGNILPLGREQGKWLFKSERKSRREGDIVQVTCDYRCPDGSVAARDDIVYRGGHLVSFAEEELQIGEKGSASIRPDPKNPAKQTIFFQYTVGLGPAAKSSAATEVLGSNTLVDDMIPAFIVSNWNELKTGNAVKFRYIVLSRKETVGFKLVKESEATWQGKPVVRIKMQPTSLIIAQIVDPLVFVVEKEGQHRILEYIGRTTPFVRQGNKWKELDATSVFQWD